MRWVVTVVFALLLLFTSQARAEDLHNPPLPTPQSTELKDKQRDKKLELNFSYYPQFDSSHPYESLMPERDPPGIRYLYAGLPLVLYKQVDRFYYRYREQYVRNLYGSNRSFFELEDENRRFCEAENDLENGTWWTRSWRDSLVPEAGGAPAERYEVRRGEELNVIDWGWISLNNEGKITFGNWSLHFEAQRADTTKSEVPPLGPVTPDPVFKKIGFQLGQLRNGRVLPRELAPYLDIRFRPAIRFQLPTAQDLNPLATISMSVEAKICPDGKHLIAIFSARVEYDHSRNVSATFNLNLLVF